MVETVKIDVDHITRVEGHGNIKIDIVDGKIKECKLEVVEAPRFFEAALRSRRYRDVAKIVSRICGICSVGHQLASVKATEDAFKIEITPQSHNLKVLLDMGQYFESHSLHVYFLAVPDFLGAKSVFPLIATHKEVVLSALKLKKLGHDIGDMIGGRLVHPISLEPGGFTMMPTLAKLEEILRRIEDARTDLAAGVKLLKSCSIPDFERETEYISMRSEGEYAFIRGDIHSSDTGTVPSGDYRKVTNEYLVGHSTAKRTKFNRASYMVGALARFNNNYEWLSERAKEAASELGLAPICHNPYMNTPAQLVELFHIVDESERIIKEMLNDGIKDETPIEPKLRKSRGVGAVEVPRGILFHEYHYDDTGRIIEADCVIPTAQNLQNLEDDMKELVPQALAASRSPEEITNAVEMLARAYDPCISCSCH